MTDQGASTGDVSAECPRQQRHLVAGDDADGKRPAMRAAGLAVRGHFGQRHPSRRAAGPAPDGGTMTQWRDRPAASSATATPAGNVSRPRRGARGTVHEAVVSGIARYRSSVCAMAPALRQISLVGATPSPRKKPANQTGRANTGAPAAAAATRSRAAGNEPITRHRTISELAQFGPAYMQARQQATRTEISLPASGSAAALPYVIWQRRSRDADLSSSLPWHRVRHQPPRCCDSPPSPARRRWRSSGSAGTACR